MDGCAASVHFSQQCESQNVCLQSQMSYFYDLKTPAQLAYRTKCCGVPDWLFEPCRTETKGIPGLKQRLYRREVSVIDSSVVILYLLQIHIRSSPYSSFSCCPRARRCTNPAPPSKVVSKTHAFCSPVTMVSDTRGATCTSGTTAGTRTTSACVKWRCLHTGVRTYAFYFSLSMVCAQYYAQCCR